MLKRLYVRFLLWALGPAIKEMRLQASQVKVVNNEPGSRYLAGFGLSPTEVNVSKVMSEHIRDAVAKAFSAGENSPFRRLYP